MSKDHLAIYLNDHLAGATDALELLDHLAAEVPALASTLGTLKADISADREVLQKLMSRLHVPESRLRKAGGWIAERLAEIKLAADDEDSGPLRRLERFEALSLGIEGKVALWLALEAAAVAIDDEVKNVDYPNLIQRGRDQRSLVETLRLEAARAALVT
jgi:hypothetical protein